MPTDRLGNGARTVIFVTGLHHSGTTAAGFKLAQQHAGLMVGECRDFFEGRPARRQGTHQTCSCGATMQACSFWGNFFGRSWADEHDKHRWLLEGAGSLGVDTIVDTSKEAAQLECWLRLPVEVRVVYMQRSPWAWSASIAAAYRNSGSRPAPRIWYALQWYLANSARKRRISRLVGSMDLMRGDRIEIEPKPIVHHVANGNRCKYVLAGHCATA